jgi:hypothetical protein
MPYRYVGFFVGAGFLFLLFHTSNVDFLLEVKKCLLVIF